MTNRKPEPLPEWMRDAIAAEPKGFMRDVIRDARNGISQSASMIPDRRRSEDKPRAAGGGSVPIQPPPGINYIDQLCDAADRNDRLAALKVKIETRWLEAQFEEQAKGPRVETEWNPFDRENMKR